MACSDSFALSTCPNSCLNANGTSSLGIQLPNLEISSGARIAPCSGLVSKICHAFRFVGFWFSAQSSFSFGTFRASTASGALTTPSFAFSRICSAWSFVFARSDMPEPRRKYVASISAVLRSYIFEVRFIRNQTAIAGGGSIVIIRDVRKSRT